MLSGSSLNEQWSCYTFFSSGFQGENIKKYRSLSSGCQVPWFSHILKCNSVFPVKISQTLSSIFICFDYDVTRFLGLNYSKMDRYITHFSILSHLLEQSGYLTLKLQHILWERTHLTNKGLFFFYEQWFYSMSCKTSVLWKRWNAILGMAWDAIANCPLMSNFLLSQK